MTLPPPLDPRWIPSHGDRRKPDPLIEKISHVMDHAVPLGKRFSIGLDPFIGLIPFVGDVICGLVSSFLVFRAARSGIPRSALLRMTLNVIINVVGGAVPFLGAVFDFFWKANDKNVRIYRECMAGGRDDSSDWLFLGVIGSLLVLTLALPLIILACILYWLATTPIGF